MQVRQHTSSRGIDYEILAYTEDELAQLIDLGEEAHAWVDDNAEIIEVVHHEN